MASGNAIRRLDYWILQSKRWIREEKRVYFEVQCRDGAVMTIYRRDGELVLAGVWTDSSTHVTGGETAMERRNFTRSLTGDLAIVLTLALAGAGHPKEGKKGWTVPPSGSNISAAVGSSTDRVPHARRTTPSL